MENPHHSEVTPTANKSRALETFFFEEYYMYVEHYVYNKEEHINIYIYMLEMCIYIYTSRTCKVTYNQWKVIWQTKTSCIYNGGTLY